MSVPRGGHLHLDCFAGIAGDMFLGAALDLGVPEAIVREALATLDLEGYELVVSRAKRMGLEGCDVKVLVAGDTHPHHHEHPHEHPHPHPRPEPGARPPVAHRSYTSIRALVERSPLPGGVKARAHDIFARIARAESKLHGMAEDEIEFHEVGAIDSLVDIVGAAVCLDQLAPSRVTSRRIPLGHGTTRCAHGILPVPSPAVLEILEGATVEDGGAPIELCTPTGAAIAASCVQAYGELPSGKILASGYGVGDRILDDRPNLLRLVVLEPSREGAEEEAVVLEANIDDMSHELCGHAMERLFAAGARDVWFTPILMKKGRPALTLSVLCDPSLLEAVGSELLRETTSIGFRYRPVGRRTLERRSVTVETPYGEIPVKLALERGEVWNAAPEYEACREAALRARVPLKEVFAAALASYTPSGRAGDPRSR
jgi:pyridinium-3,5-bisthiocarboxylic acid mononucleotide nickel chelatase